MLCRLQRTDRAPGPLLAFLHEAGVFDPELEVDSTEELRVGCEALNSPRRRLRHECPDGERGF